MSGILIYSDKDQLALELLAAARVIAEPAGLAIKAVSINNDDQSQILADAGAAVYKINQAELLLADVAAVASALQQAADQLDLETVLLSSNRRGKELAGRLAQMRGAGCITDVNAITLEAGKITCQRYALGGATVATQYIAADKKVIAIMPQSFAAAAAGAGTINALQVEVKPSPLKVVEVRPKSADQVNIEAAAVLVVVGQGLNSQADLSGVEDLARILGGEIACSKPVATDKKWLSEERVIGLSGKKCQPDLAILLGISGQVQFTVGIRDAKIIVAVNTDENAYIHQMADYYMVADLHQVVPELNQALA